MKIKIILMIAVGILLYIIFFRVLPKLSTKHYGCYLFHEVYDQKVNGAVKKKYTDSSNHNYQKIIYSSENNIEGEMIFTPELEDMYEFLNIGDSIIKEKNSVYYRVKSKSTGKDTVFKFVNSCKDTISNLK